ncbi:MAG: thiamine pyrophosphokinase, partial [Pseudomonadota bacterium]
ELPDQETTDFEKCLYTVSSPLYLAAGFTGRRTDHTLAAFHALLRHPGKSVVLIGEDDVIANVPAGHEIRLDLAIGDRVSFVPLAPIRGTHSAGLAWSINGLEMAMGTQIGTSNRVVGRDVRFSFDRPGALVLLERHALLPLVRALAD